MPSPSESFLVLSDIHLGSDLDDGGGDNHHAPRRSSEVDRDLVALVRYYRALPPKADRWHIVVAGDFIDFIGMRITSASDPDRLETQLTEEERAHGLGGAADHAREKLRRVAHRHADVFAELGAFVADGHALTLVHGNHDIELHWDVVKEEFRQLLAFHARSARDGARGEALDESAFAARIAFDPWFFWRDGVAFIEHGHQYDPFCATMHIMAPLSPLDPRRIARGFCDVLLRYVVRPTRGMTESGHEDVGLAHYLHFGVRLGFRGMITLGLRFARAVRELFRLRAASLSEAARELRRDHDRRIAQLAAAKRIGVERLRRLLALQSAPITSSIRGIMASVLLDRLALGCAALLSMALILVLGFTAWACFAILPLWAIVHYALSRQRSVDPSRQLADRAAQLASLFPAAFIVMGHTHVPQTIRAGAATYINVGSWAEHEDGSDRAARTHLVIHVTPTGAEAQFCTWGSGGPEKVE
jgi:UDP-2,3-diacylglucosamine pyrophosphatase LpxH